MRRRQASQLERRLVWILGSPRSGSTWLLGLLATLASGTAIDEPLIGLHLGALLPDAMNAPARLFTPDRMRVVDNQATSHHYIFNAEFRSAWLPALRQLLLSRFAAELSTANGDGRRYVFIKEPNGSLAADVLLAATPASRLLFLLRDGRDVVDSQLDAAHPEAWLAELGGGEEMSPQRRRAFLEERAYRWVTSTAVVKAAYNSLPEDRRLLLRYEDMLADPHQHLEAVLTWLGVGIPDTLGSVIAERQFDTLQQTGKGQFARAAQPGLWRDNLTPQEQEMLAAVMGDTLTGFGYTV